MLEDDQRFIRDTFVRMRPRLSQARESAQLSRFSAPAPLLEARPFLDRFWVLLRRAWAIPLEALRNYSHLPVLRCILHHLTYPTSL